MITRILLLVTALSMAGCGVAYTSIRQDPDGSYIVTGANAGFFRMNGEVYHCSPDGARMKCQLTGEN
jgi:hypothetical protein